MEKKSPRDFVLFHYFTYSFILFYSILFYSIPCVARQREKAKSEKRKKERKILAACIQSNPIHSNQSINQPRPSVMISSLALTQKAQSNPLFQISRSRKTSNLYTYARFSWFVLKKGEVGFEHGRQDFIARKGREERDGFCIFLPSKKDF